MQVVIEKETVLTHESVKCLFASMSKGRVTDIVDKGQGFDQVHIDMQSRRERTGYLRNFEGVSETVAEMIGIPAGENLRLRFQPTKRARVYDAVTVPLKVVPVGVLGLGITPAARLFHANGVISEHGKRIIEAFKLSKFQGFKVHTHLETLTTLGL